MFGAARSPILVRPHPPPKMRSFALGILVLAACRASDRAPAPAAAPAAPPTGTDSVAARLERASRRFADENQIPGLAVGVIRNGQVIYRQGIGVTALGNGAPVTSQTIYHMASVSKPFTATAVMQLVEEGKVALDSTVTRYVPYFRMKDPRARAITVRQVLSHVAGLPDVTDYRWANPESD